MTKTKQKTAKSSAATGKHTRHASPTHPSSARDANVSARSKTAHNARHSGIPRENPATTSLKMKNARKPKKPRATTANPISIEKDSTPTSATSPAPPPNYPNPPATNKNTP